ncbi:hypothetical protein F3N42_11075 [Marinihelvus fidelis]|uniref:Uncharacterized protein n=1 Tax=Marinihelvus fidelis TaxID=2613842 RepID=A0A5N0T767_9GAMM|nr:hypothetical protein [Marinihelvus fidelis]KAA9130895.1 hypothetical protein F3N42_11075 [Marinihelvus fidelis]
MNRSTRTQTRTPHAVAIMMAGLAAVMVAAPAAAQPLVGTCGDLPDHLEACTAFECTFTHPFTGGEETRAVVGEENGNCHYRESMPNDGEMNCSYDEATRKTMATYYRSYFTTGGPPDGEDAFNNALKDGTCEVSGY